jgi:hypothetical protein
MTAFRTAVEAILNKNEKMIITSGVVKAINENSIDVERDGMADLLEVRFNSILTTVENEFKITPKERSVVLCGIIENDTSEAYLLGCSEIDSIKFKVNNCEFYLDKTGVKIDNNGENLSNVLSDWIDEVSKILVIQGKTINVTAMTAIKERLNNILK